MASIVTAIEVHAPIERCFDLARCIDFHTRSMAASGERAVDGVICGLIGEGQQVTWRARHFGFWRELTSRVTICDRPRLFVDEQAKGDFAWFRHEHRFDAESPEVTRLTDRFEFASPWGILGRAADALFLTRYMRRLIEGHAIRLKAALESDEWRSFLPAGQKGGA